jgi:hypothetical protein
MVSFSVRVVVMEASAGLLEPPVAFA